MGFVTLGDRDKVVTSSLITGAAGGKSIDDAERRFMDLFEVEKARMRKKENELKEVISRLRRKLKVSEKK